MKLKLILLFSLCLFCGCSDSAISESSVVEFAQPETEQVSEMPVTETMIPTTETPQEELTEKEIVRAVWDDMYGAYYGDPDKPYPVFDGSKLVTYENEVEYLMHRAEILPQKYLGHIEDEQDLIQKAREILIDIDGEDYVKYVESDSIEVDGVEMAVERKYPPYTTKYYEDYDIWYIVPNPPSGTREDGKGFDVIWDFPPYFFIRGEDGKILAFFN
ncbi:MAG: hypothetical protein V3G42_00515 [Oscillospiraceae bacterium]